MFHNNWPFHATNDGAEHEKKTAFFCYIQYKSRWSLAELKVKNKK